MNDLVGTTVYDKVNECEATITRTSMVAGESLCYHLRDAKGQEWCQWPRNVGEVGTTVLNPLRIRPGDKVELDIYDDPMTAYVTNWQFRQGGQVFLRVAPREAQRFDHEAGDWIHASCVSKVLETGEIARTKLIDSAVLV